LGIDNACQSQVESSRVDGVAFHGTVLLVLDYEAAAPKHVRRTLHRLLARGAGHPTDRLEILAFVDEARGEVTDAVRSYWAGPCDIRLGLHEIDAYAEEVAESINRWVADLRESLERAAQTVGGSSWAKRFGRLWWYMKVSEKNTPLDQVWSACVRLDAVQRRLATGAYGRCIVVGDAAIVQAIRQICADQQVPCDTATVGQPQCVWPRLIAMRARAAWGVASAVRWARRYDARSPRHHEQGGRLRLAAFTWPEFWRQRFGRWEDVYYGESIERARKTSPHETIYIAGIYGRAYIAPRVAAAQRAMLRQPQWRDIPHIVLEAYGSVRRVAAMYLSMLDALRFWRMTRTHAYRSAWEWHGLQLEPLFRHMLWESVLVRWPFLLLQEELAEAALRRLRPDTAVVYSFEYLGGRALLSGARRVPGARIVAMQHGPVAPMKWLYTGRPKELASTAFGSPGLPQADIYTVDGSLSRRMLIARGLSPEQIVVTEAARMDPVWARARTARERARCEAHPARVLIAPGLYDTRFVTQFVLEAFSGDPRVHLIFKPHPKISPEQVRVVLETWSRKTGRPVTNVEIVRQGEIYEWLEQADLLVSTYSSTAIEAIAFGVPAVLLGSHRQLDLSPFFVVDKPVLSPGEPQSLRDSVGRLLEDAAFRREYMQRLETVLHDVFGTLDGCGSERLARSLVGA
jgi:surface carbohydrate biosynthesis protein (TIGR04326 family)